jgi:ABC-type sugar transport system substrate-binding protein
MSLSTKTPRVVRRLAGLAAVGAAVAIAGAGCGSTSSSSSPSSSSGPSGTTVATNASASSPSASLSQAQQAIAQYTQRPTSITVTAPVGKSIPTGKKIVFISCGASACILQGNIVKQGAALLGWKSTTIATDGSPAQIQNAYDTAVRTGADAIVTTAAIRAELTAQIPKLQAKGIPVSNCCSTDPVAAPFIYNTSTSPQNLTLGKMLAAEVVADSKGKADTLFVNIPAFTILAPLGKAFQRYYNQWCAGCSYASIDVALTQVANAPNLIVSYLRSHPSVKYVVLSVSDALGTGLPGALTAAGLTGVKVLGQGGDPTSFQYLADGQFLALAPFDYYGVDYQMLDALARHFAGVPVQMTPPPRWLLTKSNLPANHTQPFPLVATNQSQFTKLWGKS